MAGCDWGYELYSLSCRDRRCFGDLGQWQSFGAECSRAAPWVRLLVGGYTRLRCLCRVHCNRRLIWCGWRLTDEVQMLHPQLRTRAETQREKIVHSREMGPLLGMPSVDPKRDDQRRTTRTRSVKPLSGHRLRNWVKWEHRDCKNLKLWQQKTATPPHHCITALNVVTLLICFIETCLRPSDVPQRIFIL